MREFPRRTKMAPTKKEVLNNILCRDYYPKWREVAQAFGEDQAEHVARILDELTESGDIIVDGDGEILVVKATSERLSKMLDKAVRLR